MEPIILLLDTSTLDSTNYALHNGALESLQKYVQRGEVILWLSNITVNEAEKHISHKVSEAMKNVKNEKGLLILRNTKKYRKLFEIVDSDKVVEKAAIDAINEFRTFLKKNKVKILNNRGVTIDAIVADYFAERPPFCGGKKKAEFPDAIMIAKVKKELNNIDELHVVSSDTDWEKAFIQERKVTIYKSIKDFLNCLNMRSKIFKEVLGFLNSTASKSQICSLIKDLLENTAFEVDGQDCDRDGIVSGYEYDEVVDQQISEVKIKFDSIEFIDNELADTQKEKADGIIKAIVSCAAKIEVECTFLDESDSVWDPEEKEYIFKAMGTANEEHEIDFLVCVEIKATRECEIVFEVKKIYPDDLSAQLDNETLKSREYKDDNRDDWYEPDRGFEVRKLYKCPKCGTEIKINLIEFAEVVCVNDRQMGGENEYTIECDDECPTCKKEYSITGGLWEYPVLILNYDTTEIEWKD